jgi:hypothetical protein
MSEALQTGSDFNDLQTLAQEYLDACAEALSVTPAGAPTFRFVSPGPPSWDCCPMLTVHVGGPVVADTFPLQPQLGPTHRVARAVTVDMILLTATILRCDPTLSEEGVLPDPVEMTATAAQTNADVWAVWNYVTQMKRRNLLWPPKVREFAFDPAIAQKQQGGCCGWEIPIRVNLPGHVPSNIPA